MLLVVLLISSRYSSFRQQSSSSRVFDKHCSIEFMKQVLPTLRKPTNPRDAMHDDVTDDVVSGELLCICSIQNVSISKTSTFRKKATLVYRTYGDSSRYPLFIFIKQRFPNLYISLYLKGCSHCSLETNEQSATRFLFTCFRLRLRFSLR